MPNEGERGQKLALRTVLEHRNKEHQRPGSKHTLNSHKGERGAVLVQNKSFQRTCSKEDLMHTELWPYNTEREQTHSLTAQAAMAPDAAPVTSVWGLSGTEGQSQEAPLTNVSCASAGL